MSLHSRKIDNCKLYKSTLCCVCLPKIQSVITICTYVQNIYEPLMVSQQLTITRRSPSGQFVSTLGLGCSAGFGNFSMVILQYICELSWVCLGWGLEINLHHFQLGHSLLLMPNFLPNIMIGNFVLITTLPSIQNKEQYKELLSKYLQNEKSEILHFSFSSIPYVTIIWSLNRYESYALYHSTLEHSQ